MHRKLIISLLSGLLFLNIPLEAQILKGFGKKVEQKVIDRVDRKADRSVDKVLDKADKETDKPLNDALNKPASKKEKKAENEEKATAANKPQPVVITAPKSVADGLVLMSESCFDFIWFKKGAFMEFESTDSGDKGLHKSKMTILNISQVGNVTVADVRASDDKGNDFEMQYKCSGDKMYMDFGALMREAMKKAGQSGANDAQVQKAMKQTEINLGDGFMAFPKNMYAGQALDEVTVSIKVSPTPQMSMEVISTLTDRKVVGKEKITTPAGTFDCMKITGLRRSSMKMMGMNNKMPSTIEHMWFAPKIGIIKQENITEKGKLDSRTQLTAYKL